MNCGENIFIHLILWRGERGKNKIAITMIPKIIFKYSRIYDQNWKEWIKYYRHRDRTYPSSQKVQAFIKKVEKLWRKNEKKVLKEISKITGLKWKEQTIVCYVVGNCAVFSDPLTLRVYKNPDYFIDALIHELIHYGDSSKTTKVSKYFNQKYRKESSRTIAHILVNAFHWHIFLKFYGEKRLQRWIKFLSVMPFLKRSWEIIQEEGYQNIIDEFKK